MKFYRYIWAIAWLMANLANGGTTQAPCTADGTLNVVALGSPTAGTYCISDAGWSDTWLKGQPTAYSSALDMLSGDNSAFLRYKIGGLNGNGSGWLSPFMDQGTLVPQPQNSNWVVKSPVTVLTATLAQSTITDVADHVDIVIDTYLNPFGVTQTYTIYNNGASALTNVSFGDYYNLHPNSSRNPTAGITSYSNGTVSTVGNKSGTFYLNDGTFSGQTIPATVFLGTVSNVLTFVNSNSSVSSTATVGPNDTAAALIWNITNINPGASQSFSITLNATATPEPALFVAVGATLIAIFAARRKILPEISS